MVVVDIVVAVAVVVVVVVDMVDVVAAASRETIPSPRVSSISHAP